jgi:ribonuclease P protein component
MLRKTRKLNLAWEENHNFYRLFERKVGRVISLYARKQLPESINSRATVVVGKKVSLLATQRNQVKRSLYRLLTEAKSWQLGRDIVIVVHKLTSLEDYLAEIKYFLKLT